MGKLALHVNSWVGNTKDAVLRGRPDFLKVLELNREALVAYKQAKPNGKVLYRKYFSYQPLNDPITNANNVADQVLADVRDYHGLVDMLEGYNETGLWDDAVHYNQFTIQLAKRYHDAGFEFVSYCFPEENPDMSLWDVYLPGIQASDYLGLHEYSAPTMMDKQGDRCFRYRRVYDYLKNKVKNLRIMITEAGIDGGVVGRPATGWKQFTDEAGYLSQLKWYTEGVNQDDYLVCFHIFCCGTADKQWDGFDIRDCPSILDYCASLPLIKRVVDQPPPKPVPPPVVKKVTHNGYAGALWLPSPDFGYPTATKGRNGFKPIAIVCHIAQGSETALDAEFSNPNSDASSTYGSNRDGTIHQYVDDLDAAWANGITFSKGYNAYKSNLNIDWIKNCWDKQLSPNLFTISIEHEGTTGVPLTEAQYQGTLNLIKYLVRTYGIPVDANHIVGHYQIDSVTRPQCPGSAFPWVRLFADLRGDVTMANFLGAPHGGATEFSKAHGNVIGTYSQVLVMTFATGCLWASPDDNWVAHEGLPAAMTDDQVRAYAADIWLRGQAQFVPGQSIPEFWLKGLLSQRK